MPSYYILKGGQPAPEPNVIKWAKWFGAAGEARRVALTAIDDVTVSTVFLGLDHSFGRGGQPLLFETLVMGGEFDGQMQRYSSLEEAEEGHEEMVERIRNSIRNSMKGGRK